MEQKLEFVQVEKEKMILRWRLKSRLNSIIKLTSHSNHFCELQATARDTFSDNNLFTDVLFAFTSLNRKSDVVQSAAQSFFPPVSRFHTKRTFFFDSV
jgi:hypothetical protein